jgi:hypothetical protein
VRSNTVKSGEAKRGWVRYSLAKRCSVWRGEDRGEVGWGMARYGEARYGEVRYGK